MLDVIGPESEIGTFTQQWGSTPLPNKMQTAQKTRALTCISEMRCTKSHSRKCTMLLNSPHIELLNFPIPSDAKSPQQLILLIFTGAKLTIATAWKQPSVSFTKAKRKISWLMAQEKVSKVLNAMEKF